MNKTVKWILIALAIIAAIVLIIIGIKYLLEQSAPPAPAPPPAGGPSNAIVDALGALVAGLGGLFGGAKKCDPARPGFQKDGVYNPDKCGRAPGLECDPNRPGWNLGGFMDPSCE